MSDWIPLGVKAPPINEVVETKIDDVNGVRNQQPLKRGDIGKLWFVPSGESYVYYTPTHWRKMK